MVHRSARSAARPAYRAPRGQRPGCHRHPGRWSGTHQVSSPRGRALDGAIVQR